MQGENDTFVYVHLVNGKMTLTLDDGGGTQTTSLPDPYNSNGRQEVNVILYDGTVDLMVNDGMPQGLVTDGQFSIMSPIFIGGIPDSPPFEITYSQAVTNTHFVGCVRRVRLSNGTTDTTSANALAQNSDIMDGCTGACSSLDCSPDPSSAGECIEYYTHGECDCRGLPVSEGTGCNGKLSV